jgi:signal transduction histidine kinase
MDHPEEKPDLLSRFDRLYDGLSLLVSPMVHNWEERFKRLNALLFAIITIPILAGFSVSSFRSGKYLLAAFLMGNAIVFSMGFVAARIYKNMDYFYKTCLFIISLLFLYLLAVSGPDGHLALWLYILPMAVFIMMDRNQGVVFILLFILCMQVIFFLQNVIPSLEPLNEAYRFRFSFSFIVVSVLASGFQTIRQRYQSTLIEKNKALEEEKEKLAEAKKEAEAANRAKSDFLASMSHELRTPLNHIIGFTELVVGKNCGDLNEEQSEYLEDVLRSSHHLLSLINDMLDLSKIESGKFELSLDDVPLRESLEQSLLMIREKAVQKNLTTRVASPDDLLMVRADSRKLKQILYNLLSNAVKYTPDHGVITISTETFCSKDSNESPAHVKISVQDSGIGIDAEDLDRIFSPFEQLKNKSNAIHRGTGLGLALTRSLVELHGGRLRVESPGKGMGTVFHFTLPLVP